MNKLEHLKSMTNQILTLLEADNEHRPEQELRPPVGTRSDPEFFALEKKLFGRQPLMAGLSCDIPKPGDFFRGMTLESLLLSHEIMMARLMRFLISVRIERPDSKKALVTRGVSVALIMLGISG